MPGIWKKIKDIGGMITGIAAPLLNIAVPGAGAVLDLASKGVMALGDGIDGTVSDYKAAKKAGQKFTFGDGLSSAIGNTLGGVAQNIGLGGLTTGLGALSGLFK
jgi:hypothetical protein